MSTCIMPVDVFVWPLYKCVRTLLMLIMSPFKYSLVLLYINDILHTE